MVSQLLQSYTTDATVGDATGSVKGRHKVLDIDISPPAISRYLKVLEDAGLPTRRVEGAGRPCPPRQGICGH
ncbi:MAG: ArsR family transcriptional regulator [Gammaproteobacteria bacterium]|nr:ArsR family transcriptional regulator [Gammaproteobacteria bacterium]